jgi:hypothetical protein
MLRHHADCTQMPLLVLPFFPLLQSAPQAVGMVGYALHLTPAAALPVGLDHNVQHQVCPRLSKDSEGPAGPTWLGILFLLASPCRS